MSPATKRTPATSRSPRENTQFQPIAILLTTIQRRRYILTRRGEQDVSAAPKYTLLPEFSHAFLRDRQQPLRFGFAYHYDGLPSAVENDRHQ